MRIVYVLAMIMLCPVSAVAASITGEITVALIDPLTMEESEARAFCLRNSQTIKCQELEEHWKEELRSRRKNSLHGNDVKNHQRERYSHQAHNPIQTAQPHNIEPQAGEATLPVPHDAKEDIYQERLKKLKNHQAFVH